VALHDQGRPKARSVALRDRTSKFGEEEPRHPTALSSLLNRGRVAGGQLESSGAVQAPRQEQRPQWEMAFAVFLITAIVFSLSPVITNYDSFATFPTAVSLVNRHTLSLDAYQHVKVLAGSYTVSHANGHLLTSYPWSVGLFAVPAVLVIDLLHVAGGPSADSIVTDQSQIGNLTQLWSASIVTGLACATLALLAYRRLQGPAKTRRRWAMVCGLAFAFATSAWSTASRALWQHGPSILLLAIALVALDQLFPRNTEDHAPQTNSMWAPLVAGFALAGAVTIRPTNVVALVLATMLVLWKTSGRSRALYVLGVLSVLIPWGLVTAHYYGTPVQPYDQASKLGLPSTFFESLGAQLISPSRGLFIFSPIVLVAAVGLVLAHRRKSVTPLEVLSSLAFPCYLIAIALFPVWWAGTSFGPRFMTETLPFLFVLAIPFVDWLATWRSENRGSRSTIYRVAVVVSVMLLGFSVLVNAQGGLLRSSICWNLRAPTVASVDKDPARVWSWSNPQFVYGLQAIRSDGLRAAITRCPSGTPLP
jgi:hypothetical protein